MKYASTTDFYASLEFLRMRMLSCYLAGNRRSITKDLTGFSLLCRNTNFSARVPSAAKRFLFLFLLPLPPSSRIDGIPWQSLPVSFTIPVLPDCLDQLSLIKVLITIKLTKDYRAEV